MKKIPNLSEDFDTCISSAACIKEVVVGNSEGEKSIKNSLIFHASFGHLHQFISCFISFSDN